MLKYILLGLISRTNLFIVDEMSNLYFQIILILLKILLTTPDKVIRSGIGEEMTERETQMKE